MSKWHLLLLKHYLQEHKPSVSCVTQMQFAGGSVITKQEEGDELPERCQWRCGEAAQNAILTKRAPVGWRQRQTHQRCSCSLLF